MANFASCHVVPACTKQRWICRQCMKTLSSKRSYDEHMNIHNKIRPFACEDCDYAAASQMTLTRHRQRRHTPRQEWHYQCPYCAEPYMEPASYRQHVLGHHYGRSATFGCPYGDCSYKTKSSKAFREHLSKHQSVIISRANQMRVPNSFTTTPTVPHQQFDFDHLEFYMVDDECGIGNTTRQPRKFEIYSSSAGSNEQQQNKRPILMVLRRSADVEVAERRHPKVIRVNVDLLDDEDLATTSSSEKGTSLPIILTQASSKWPTKVSSQDQMVVQQPFVQAQSPLPHQLAQLSSLPSEDWMIEAEVVIDEEANRAPNLPDGQTDDFGLD